MQIIYSIANLSILFNVDKKTIKNWTRLGLLPKIEGAVPTQYDKAVIDSWVADGRLEKLRGSGTKRRKGKYGKG